MQELVIAVALLGNVAVTSYRSVPNQTDDTPFHTSTGEHVNERGIAVSRDLLKRWGGPLNYGDQVYIDGVGFKYVNDCMAERHKNAIDIWVPTLKDEKAFDKKYAGKKLTMWVIRDKRTK